MTTPVDQSLARFGSIVERLRLDALDDHKPLLCLAMIVKNEADNIVGVLDAAKSIVDRVMILDTGSTDGTLEQLRNWGDENPTYRLDLRHGEFKGFGTSRNEMLALAAPLAKWTLWLSGNEYLYDPSSRIRSCLGSLAREVETVNLRLRYGAFSFDTPRLVMAGRGWKFHYEVHEQLRNEGRGPFNVRVPEVSIEHRMSLHDHQRKLYRRYRDFEALHRVLEKDPQDAHATYNLGHLCRDLGMLAESARLFKRYVTLPDAWSEPIYDALYASGVISQRLERPWSETLQWFHSAWQMCPHRAEPFYEIARYYHSTQQNILAREYAAKAAAMPFPEDSTIFVHPSVYATDAKALLVAIEAAIQRGDSIANVDI